MTSARVVSTSRQSQPTPTTDNRSVTAVQGNSPSSQTSKTSSQLTPPQSQSVQAILAGKLLDIDKFDKLLNDCLEGLHLPPTVASQITFQDKGKYFGMLINGKREGFGEYFFPNNDYYRGIWQNDTMAGVGYYKYASNNKAYFGQFANGRNHGHGVLAIDELPPTIVYKGQWNNGQKHGKGSYVYNYQPLEFYDGFWERGQKSGIGMYYRDESVFVGEWFQNKRNGKGQYTTKQGIKYVGVWKDDVLEQAMVYYPRPGGLGYDQYKGEVSKGQRQGKGVYTYAQGGRYQGGYSNDMKNGQGTEVVNSHIYKGEFLNDKKHGFGIYTYPNGDKYQGTFIDGKKHGTNCLYTWPDGSTFRGTFANDIMQQGIFIDAVDKVPRSMSRGVLV